MYRLILQENMARGATLMVSFFLGSSNPIAGVFRGLS